MGILGSKSKFLSCKTTPRSVYPCTLIHLFSVKCQVRNLQGTLCIHHQAETIGGKWPFAVLMVWVSSLVSAKGPSPPCVSDVARRGEGALNQHGVGQILCLTYGPLQREYPYMATRGRGAGRGGAKPVEDVPGKV